MKLDWLEISLGVTRQCLRDSVLVRFFSLLHDGARLKCLCTNASSMRNEQEELAALTHSQSCNIIGISKTWGEKSCDWCAMIDGCRLFRSNR